MSEEISSGMSVAGDLLNIGSSLVQDTLKLFDILTEDCKNFKKSEIREAILQGDSFGTITVPYEDIEKYQQELVKNDIPYSLGNPEKNTDTVILIKTSDYDKVYEVLGIDKDSLKRGEINVSNLDLEDYTSELIKAGIDYQVRAAAVGTMTFQIDKQYLDRAQQVLENLERKDVEKLKVDVPEKINDIFGNKRVIELAGLNREEIMLTTKELERRGIKHNTDLTKGTITTLERDENELERATKTALLDLQMPESKYYKDKFEKETQLEGFLVNAIKGRDITDRTKELTPTVLFDASRPDHMLILRKDGYEHYLNGELRDSRSIKDESYEREVATISKTMLVPEVKKKEEFTQMSQEEKQSSYYDFLRAQNQLKILEKRRGKFYKSIELNITDEDPCKVEIGTLGEVNPNVEGEVNELKTRLANRTENLTVTRYHHEKEFVQTRDDFGKEREYTKGQTKDSIETELVPQSEDKETRDFGDDWS